MKAVYKMLVNKYQYYYIDFYSCYYYFRANRPEHRTEPN